MKNQIKFQKQIRILGLSLSLILAATVFVVIGTPVAACPMESCRIELKETTITAGEEITFPVRMLDQNGIDEGWAPYVFGTDPYKPQDGCKFEIDSAAGGSWNSNTYTSEFPGVWEVTVHCTATIEGVTNTRTDTITITVLPAGQGPEVPPAEELEPVVDQGPVGPSLEKLVKIVNNYENAVRMLLGTGEAEVEEESTMLAKIDMKQLLAGMPLHI